MGPSFQFPLLPSRVIAIEETRWCWTVLCHRSEVLRCKTDPFDPFSVTAPLSPS